MKFIDKVYSLLILFLGSISSKLIGCTKMSIIYPSSIRNVVSKMTSVTQAALQKRQSRLEIELPPAVDFGLELSRKREIDFAKISDVDKIKRSNRDASRLFVEMFSSISSSIAVLFPSTGEADTARDLWAPLFRGQILSTDTPSGKGYGKLRSRRFSAQEQEQALMSSDGIYVPDGTEVLLVSGPRPKDFKKLLQIHEKLGDDTLIILVNGRLDTVLSTGSTLEQESAASMRQKFLPIFHYAPPPPALLPPNISRELLLYHEIDKNWYLAEKLGRSSGIGSIIGLGGGFETLLETNNRPTFEEISTVLKK